MEVNVSSNVEVCHVSEVSESNSNNLAEIVHDTSVDDDAMEVHDAFDGASNVSEVLAYNDKDYDKDYDYDYDIDY